MMNKDEKKILNLIRILPLFIIFFSIIITYIIITNNNLKFETEINKLQSDLINTHKEFIKKEVERVYNFLNNEEKFTIETLKNSIKLRVYEAHAIATSIYNHNREKEPSEVRKLIKNALRDIRFNNNRGYYFIYETSGINILHPLLPHIEGKNLLSFKDLKGSPIIQQSISIVRTKGEGFLRWWFKKSKDKKTEYEKIGFLKYFEPYDWFMGTGEYVEDVKNDIQKRVLSTINKTKYDKNGYIFILDEKGMALSHINKKLIGRNIINLKNKNNVMIAKELLKISKKGEGFFQYMFAEPSTGNDAMKTTFVKGFEKWGWTIGMGIYNTDIQLIIKNKRKSLEEENEDQMISIFTTSIILTIILLIFSVIFSNIIKEKFRKYKTMVDKKTKELKELNKSLEQKVQKRTNDLTQKTNKVTDLLNNAAQGFLSFGKDFLIDDEYSVECENLLGKDLKDKDITQLVFNKKTDKINFFKETMLDALNEKNELTSSLLLSLLPNQLIINKRAVHIDYKMLSNNKFMMILTNITEKKKLQIKIKKEQVTLKMIVAIVSDSVQFYETKENFEDFCKDSLLFINQKHSPKENANTLHALLHTFKGLFAQLYMQNTVKRLHHFESKILELIAQDKNNNELKNLIESFDLIQSIHEDLEVVTQTLGEKFLSEHNHIHIDEDLLNKLEDKINIFCTQNSEQKQECESILFDIKRIKNKSLHYYLSIYPKLCQQLCFSLNKSIDPFEIIGENNTFVPEGFKPFINSLVHVFRNSCDHGIELKADRLSLNKNETGNICCEFKTVNNRLYIEISDDGKGIDINLLKNKIVENRLNTEEKVNVLSKEEILEYIFDNNLSTNESINHVSGRGIGLASVKIELDKLQGEVEIKTQMNKGTTFIFMLPLKNN